MSEQDWVQLMTIVLMSVIFFITYHSTTFAPRHTLYGVFVGDAEWPTDRLNRLHRQFRWSLLWVLIMLMVFSVAATPWLASVHVSFVSAPLILQWVLYSLIYVRTHSSAKRLLADLPTKPTPSTVRHVDLAFLQWKIKWQVIFTRLHSLPALVTVSLFGYMVVHYPKVPEQIPTHWNGLGQIDAYVNKEPFFVFFPLGLPLLLVVLFWLIGRSVFRLRVTLGPGSNRHATSLLLALSIGLLGFSLFLTMFACMSAYSMVTSGDLPRAWLMIELSLLLASLVTVVYYFIQYRRAVNAMPKEVTGTYRVEDDHRYWKWGMFYHNPTDPVLFVEKRDGAGWTVNTGHWKGKLLLMVLFLPVLAIMLLIVLTV